MRIKGFDENLCCRGIQFEIGKEYKIEKNEPLRLCSDTVFHYCDSLQKVHNFYSCEESENNRFCEIEVLGKEITDGIKCGSNHIKIIREIVGEELNSLKGLVNGNTGLFNSGYWNSGDRNSGDRNSGDWNSGDWNSGYRNSGYWNSGYRNSGDWNSGDLNSGRYNSGHKNTGIFNSCNYSSGVFCNEDPKVRIFNVETDMTMEEFLNSKYASAIYSSTFALTEWIEYSNKEKAEDHDKEAVGGYLKAYSYKEACANWWAGMSKKNKEIIKSMPNFDKDIFKDITGIEV